MIARRQPMANDLRHVMAALRITGDLERIGDLAKNIAKRALAIAQTIAPEAAHDRPSPHGRAGARPAQGSARRLCRARRRSRLAVWRDDENIDAMYNSLFRELLTYMMEDPRNIGLSTHLLFGAKNIERVGDHTTNIAENGPLPSPWREHH